MSALISAVSVRMSLVMGAGPIMLAPRLPAHGPSGSSFGPPDPSSLTTSGPTSTMAAMLRRGLILAAVLAAAVSSAQAAQAPLHLVLSRALVVPHVSQAHSAA